MRKILAGVLFLLALPARGLTLVPIAPTISGNQLTAQIAIGGVAADLTITYESVDGLTRLFRAPSATDPSANITASLQMGSIRAGGAARRLDEAEAILLRKTGNREQRAELLTLRGLLLRERGDAAGSRAAFAAALGG